MRTNFTVSFIELLIGSFASTHKAPSFNVGKNSEPKNLKENVLAAMMIMAAQKLLFLFRNVKANPLETILLKKFTTGLWRSFTSLSNRILHNTGTSVSVKSNAPNNANPNV